MTSFEVAVICPANNRDLLTRTPTKRTPYEEKQPTSGAGKSLPGPWAPPFLFGMAYNKFP